MATLLNRFPRRSAVIPVFAVISFPIFSWTTVVWFWKLPYWMNFLTAAEIGGIFSYSMVTAFLESILVMGLLLVLCYILPGKFFRDYFVIRGTWLAIGLTIAILGNGIQRYFLGFSYIEFSSLTWSVMSLLLVCILTFAATHIRFMARMANWLSDQLIVFLYILLPISIFSIVVVVARNIL